MKLRRSLLTSVALTLAVLGIATPSDAKCPFARYRLSFRIVEETTGTPVAGASIAVLANASAQELAKQDAAAPAQTGADGVFAAEYRFNTYSSLSLLAPIAATNASRRWSSSSGIPAIASGGSRWPRKN
jgi:hypothetical protein